ncbi:MAG: TolC family protein [Spirochaetes bacterium]|nr:TolC family protein [Spirochaetota bacterium]
MITSLMYFPSLAETGNKPVLKYPDFIKHIENMLPEIKANETDLMLYENKVKRSKASGDITAAAGGDYSIQEQTKTTYGTGNASTGSFYAGLNKKLIPTGTTVSTEYNYSKSRYSSLSTGLDYSTYEPSVSLKITQPLLYNFLGRVDKYAEKNAKMQLDIERIKYSENNKSIINAYRKLYFEWILYKEILINIKESISNSKTLEEKIKRQVKAGLSDDDDYQKVVASTLAYECRYEEYLTTLKKIENEVQLYLAQLPDPDKESFNLLFMESNTDAFENVDFSKTNSAKTIELAMENLNYTREVNENKLLPELNVYSQVTRKGYSEDSSSASRMDNTDYSVGFEFTYKIGNNSAESDLKEAEINLLAMKYEYESTLNDYKKSFSGYKSSAEGTKTLLKKTGAVLKALEAQLKTETKKYNQARLNLSYVIETENSIALKKIELLELKYQLIGHYIDYKDLIK